MKKTVSLFIALIAFCCAVSGCAGGAKKKSYTVSFETFGGDVYDAVTVNDGDTLEEPMIPTNGSKSFDGWYKDAAFTKEWDFSKDKVSENMTLYAKFSNKFNVFYWFKGEVQFRKKVTEGSFAANVEYVNASRKVVNWYKDADLSHVFDFNTPITEDTNLYAYAKVVTSWEFPRDMSVGSGWQVMADTTDRKGSVKASDEGMVVTFDEPSAWDTYLRSPELDIPAMEKYTKLTIVYKNYSAVDNLKVFYFTTEDSVWSGTRADDFTVKANMTEDDDFETLVIDIPSTERLKGNWLGTLYILRFELHKREGDINDFLPGGTIVIKSISLEE